MNIVKKAGLWFARSKAKVITLVVIALFSAATVFATANYSCTITINLDGAETQISTLRTDAYAIIKQAGIELDETDIVDLSNFESGSDSTIRISKAYHITVFDNGDKGTVYLANGTVEEALKQIGITLKDGDVLNCELNDLICEGMALKITRAFPVTITADGETVKLNMAGGTVADALDAAVLTVDDDDKISASLDTELKSGMKIKITRISFEENTKTESVAFKTVTKKTSKLYVGQSKVETKGVKGEKIVTYKEKYVDGKLKESKAIATVVTKEPVSEVKLVGTKQKAGTISAGEGVKLANGVSTISRLTPPSSLKLTKNNIPSTYKRKIVGTASAYSGGGVTATGRSVLPGYIAVNPSQIPYHTKMWIVSNDGRYVYGYASAEDTGGFIYWTGSSATLCDLYMASESQASAFGRRGVTIYIL